MLVGDIAVYVRVDGRARVVATGREALEDIRRLGIRYDGPEAAERQVREVWSKQDRVTYALSVERVYEYDRYSAPPQAVYVLDGPRCTGALYGERGPCERRCAILWHADWVEPA